MLSILKSMPKQLTLANKCFSIGLRTQGERCIFSKVYFGLENFKSYSESVQTKHITEFSNLKKQLQDSISNSENKIFTEDLKNFLYMTKTDADLELLINAIKKYKSQDSSALFNFKFDSPLMRLLYTLNKTDKALELFLNDKSNIITHDLTSGNLLLNKLLEERRYDDAIKVVEKILDKSMKSDTSKLSFKHFIYGFSNLAAEAFYGKNNFEEAEKFLKKMKDNNFQLHSHAYMKLFFIATNQGKHDFAKELVSAIKIKSITVLNNFKILSFLKLNRNEEALKLAEETLAMKRNERSKAFFPEVYAELKEAESKNNEMKQRAQTLLETVDKNSKSLITITSLNEYAFKVENREFFSKNTDDLYQKNKDRRQTMRNQNRDKNRPFEQKDQRNTKDFNKKSENNNKEE